MIIYNKKAKELSTQFPDKICVDNENVYVNGSHYTFKNPPCKALKFSAKLKQEICISTIYSNTPISNFEYSFEGKDNGNWKKLGMDYVEFGNGKDIYVRGNNPEGLNGNIFAFKNSTVGVECSGNIMHLLSYKEDLVEIPSTNCFEYLFKQCPITTAPELPATTLNDYCYSHMFHDCTKLIEAPELPAIYLVYQCYNYMFYNCSSLVKGPDILAEYTTTYSCREMFSYCSSLQYIKLMAYNRNSGADFDWWNRQLPAGGTFVCRSGQNWPIASSFNGGNVVPYQWNVVEV